MRKIIRNAAIVLLAFLLGAAASWYSTPNPWQQARQFAAHETGIELKSFQVLAFSDTHGGFHGDGSTAALLQYEPMEMAPEGEDIFGETWEHAEIPAAQACEYIEQILGMRVDAFRVGFYDENIVFDRLLVHWYTPKNPISSNVTIALADEDTGLLAVYRLDT